MTADALLTEAAQLGITLWAESGAIRFRPKAAMTPQLAAKLRANRAEILLALHGDSPSPHPVTRQANPRTARESASRRIELPPPSICASPVIFCPRCTCRPVLRELQKMTGGLCYPCWEAGVEAQS